LASAFTSQTHLGQAPVLFRANPSQPNTQAEFEQWQRNTSQSPQLAHGWSEELEAFRNLQLTGTPQPGTPQLEHPTQQPLHQPQAFISSTPMMGMPMHSHMGMGMGMGSMPMLHNQFQNLGVGKGKGKEKAVDFDAAFAVAEKERIEALTSKLEQAKIVEVHDETPEKVEAVDSDFQKSVDPHAQRFQD
jgi:hypothetical protein